MDACEAVEKELLRVITKFNGVHDHANRVLGDVTKNFEELQSSIAEGMSICRVVRGDTHAQQNRWQFACVECIFSSVTVINHVRHFPNWKP